MGLVMGRDLMEVVGSRIYKPYDPLFDHAFILLARSILLLPDTPRAISQSKHDIQQECQITIFHHGECWAESHRRPSRKR